MSKLNRLQKIILSIIIVFVVIGITVRSMSGTLTSNLGYDAMTMLKYALIDYPTKTVKNWMQDFSDLWSAKEENDQLRYELSQNPAYKAKLDEATRENSELKEALKIQKAEDTYKNIWAEVYSRDMTTWNNKLTINKGSKDGIAEGMAVETVNGMIGKISDVSSNTSVVKLLTSEDKLTTAAIKINIDAKTSSEGILQSYDSKRGLYIIYLYDNNNNIKKDMQVVTSGKGGVYPSGLLIGNVESVQALNNQTGQTIYVRPVDDFQEFNYVRVIAGVKGDN